MGDTSGSGKSEQRRDHRVVRRPFASVPVAVVLAFAMLLVPTIAWANVGVPMLAVAWPASWVAFVPICIVEAAMAKRMLNLTVYQAAKVTVSANLASTLVGIPLAWLVTGVVGYASFAASIAVLPKSVEWLSAPFGILAYSAWMPPIRSAPWLVMVAGVVLCVPFYIASVMIETQVAIELLPGTPAEKVRRWCKRANQISYLAIATVVTGLGAYSAWG